MNGQSGSSRMREGEKRVWVCVQAGVTQPCFAEHKHGIHSFEKVCMRVTRLSIKTH